MHHPKRNPNSSPVSTRHRRRPRATPKPRPTLKAANQKSAQKRAPSRAIACIAAALLLFCATACEANDDSLRDFEVDTRIELTDQDGRPFRLEALENKTVLLYFGFTHCPDFCPATLSKLKKVYRILGNRSRHLQTILVTVDPARDTPEKLKSYVDYFKIDAIGLTGTPEQIAEVAERFGAHYERQPLEGGAADSPQNSDGGEEYYTVDHSTGLYLIDADRRVRHVFKHGDSPQQIAETLQLILPFF
ncbi:MAG: SCO family protein [Leptospirales bacterium]